MHIGLGVFAILAVVVVFAGAVAMKRSRDYGDSDGEGEMGEAEFASTRASTASRRADLEISRPLSHIHVVRRTTSWVTRGSRNGVFDAGRLADCRIRGEPVRLHALAYRMLGRVAEAEDAVQETWLRLRRIDAGQIENVGGLLTTVVGRVCLDRLRARRARPEDPVGDVAPSAPDEAATNPLDEALLAEAVGAPLMVVLEQLGPAERAAFVLHDVLRGAVRRHRRDSWPHARRARQLGEQSEAALAGERANRAARSGTPTATSSTRSARRPRWRPRRAHGAPPSPSGARPRRGRGGDGFAAEMRGAEDVASALSGGAAARRSRSSGVSPGSCGHPVVRSAGS